MSLIPDWAPNLHPLLVHFPLTLLIAAACVDLIGAWRPTSAALRDSSTWLYCGGALMAMGAYFSGLGAAGMMHVSPEESVAVTTHFTWADRTTWFFVVFASLRMAISYIWCATTRWVPVGSVIVALTGIGMLLTAADHGGRLVYRHGLGVAPVPSSGQPWQPVRVVPGRPGTEPD